jgi:glycosyltransferase involved in cell wall biosynthesis
VVEDALGRALCLVLPSRREGYGLVVLEALSRGTPAVVVAGPDNAAAELIEEGTNGAVVASTSPTALASAILHIAQEGIGLRASTLSQIRHDADRRMLARSLEQVAAAYEILVPTLERSVDPTGIRNHRDH